ncbi:MAG TPA: cupin domain-containing protein [Solirubrobacteraceae bacterium]|nr:cupin domain-containing protein [Solirubrobacteraceae bacterium]
MPCSIPPQRDPDAAVPGPDGPERVVELRLPAGYAGPAMHVHPAYDEVFEILEGMPTLIVGGERHAVLPGERVRVRAGVPHTFANTADLPARVVVTAARQPARARQA